jgi:predicted nucleic acid-binding protein
MIKKVFFDSDVILDVILKRLPHFEASQQVLSLAESGLLSGHTSSLLIANCYYIISHIKDHKSALKAVSKLRVFLNILPFTDKEISQSLNSEIKDFEDALEYFICINNGIDNLITRNISDYRKLEINALSPKDFLNLEEIKTIIEESGNND